MFSNSLKFKSEVLRPVLLAAFSCALVFCIGDVSPLSAAGNDRFEKRFPVGATPTVIVTNDNGLITVRGTPRSEVHVVATKRSSNVEIDTEPMGNRLRFDTHLFDRNMKPQERTVDYVLEVPEKTSLEIHNVGGRVKVDGVSGGLSIDALNSSIELNDIHGSMILRSVSGNMSVARSSGRIEANSISGDLQFTDLSSQSVDGSTTSGNISFEGNFYDNGRYTLSNYSGFIDIATPADSSFELDARSVKGSVQSEIPLKSKSHTPFNPAVMRQSLLGVYNDGAASVHLSSFSGKIRIRKK